MDSRFIEIYISILFVLILYRFLMPNFWLLETFNANTEHINAQAVIDGDDAQVYYTDNVEACKHPNTRFMDDEQLVPINYDFPQQYYSHLLRILQAQQGGSVQQVSKRDQLMKKLQDVIQEYEQFPDKQHCRVKIDDWRMIKANDEDLYFGDIKRNELRAMPKDWAFVGASPELSNQHDNPITSKKPDGSVVHTRINGNDYIHGSLKTFNYEDIKQYKQCNNSSKHNQSNDRMQYVLQVNPDTKDVGVIRDGNGVSAELSRGEVVRYFFQLQNERVEVVAGVYKLYVQLKSQPLPVHRFVKDQCSRVRERKTFSALDISFPGEILVLTRTKEAGKDIRSMQEFLQELRELQQQREILVAEYNKLRLDYFKYRAEYIKLRNTIYYQYFAMLRMRIYSYWYRYNYFQQEEYNNARQAYEQSMARKRELETFINSYENKRRDYESRIAVIDARIAWINSIFDDIYTNATREINTRLGQHNYTIDDKNVIYQHISYDGNLYLGMR